MNVNIDLRNLHEQVGENGEQVRKYAHKAALAYTDAIVWDAGLSTDELWERLDANFRPDELVELGFFIALTSGQQRWIKTLDLGHREYLGDTTAGLGAEKATHGH